jgi:hypothetical protein
MTRRKIQEEQNIIRDNMRESYDRILLRIKDLFEVCFLLFGL